MSMLNWQWQAQLSLTLSTAVHAVMGEAGAEREQEVGSNQAEFNDGKLGRARPYIDLCPSPWPMALRSQKLLGGAVVPPQGR